MPTYTAKVPTAYGTIEVLHDGTPTDDELRRMALDKVQEREKLARIEAGMQDNEPSGFSPVPSPASKIDEEEPEEDLVADLAKGFMRVAEIPQNFVMEQVLGMAGLNSTQKEAMRRTMEGASREQYLDSIASVTGAVTGEESDIKERVIDEQGQFKEATTGIGVAAEIAPFVVGGIGAGVKLAQIAPKLPSIVNGLISGATVDAVLHKTGEESMITDFERSEDEEFLEGFAKDFVEVLSIDEDDSIAEQRLKMAFEGMIIGGVAEGIFRGLGIVLPKADTVQKQAASALKQLKQARETVNINKSNIHQDLKFSETPESLAQIEQQNSSFLKRFTQQIFSSRGYFTTNAYNLFRGKEYAERQTVREAENISNRLSKALDRLPIDSVSEENITTFLTQSLNASSEFYKGLITKGEYEDSALRVAQSMGIPDDVAQELILARNLIDDLSAKLADSSIPNEQFKEIITANSGEYIRRSYRLFEDSGFKPDESLKAQVVKKLQASKLIDDPDLTPEKAYNQALGEVDKILDRGDYAGLDHYGKSVRVNREILTGKKEIDADIRRLMGEITDPADNILLTVGKMAQLVETNKFADNLLQLGQNKYIFDSAETQGKVNYGVKITGTNSALDGKYTTQEMATAIAGRQSELFSTKRSDGFLGVLEKGYIQFMKAKGVSQASKTVLSHVTHLRNYLGGMQFGVANGINPFFNRTETKRILNNAIKNQGDAGLDALYEKYLGLGVINTNVKVNEFRKLMKAGTELDGSAEDFFGSLKGYGTAGEKASDLYQWAEKRYVATDDFFKINAFEKELDVLKQAFPDEPIEVLERKAAQILQDTMPNYDKVPNGIKAFRYLPIGSFVSFPAEIVRTSGHIVMQASKEITSGNRVIAARGRARLAGFTASMGAWEGIATTASLLTGITDEEEQAIQNVSHTPWSKATRIPFRGPSGDIFVADTQFIDSYSVLKEPIKEAYHQIANGELKGRELETVIADAALTFFEKALTPYTDASIITQALVDVGIARLNDNGRTAEGKQIFPANETILNKTIDGVSHIAMSMMPGSLDSLNRLLIDADSTGFGEMYFGKAPEVSRATGSLRYDKRAELVANMIGVRFTRLDPKDKLYYAASDFQNHGRANFSKKINFGDEPEDIEREQKRNLRSNYEAQQDLYLMYESAKELVGDKEARKSMRDAGMSNKAIARISDNFYYDTDFAKTRAADLYQKVEGQPAEIRSLIGELNRSQSDYRRTRLIPVSDDDKRRQARLPKAKGGVVTDVPQVPEEPDERIDKMTGRPYDEQAGAAFTDQEDRAGLTRRLALAKGGLPKDMYRRDGSIKSAQGFLGPVENLETGKTMTELSIDLEMDGKNVQIPTMVPTLTAEEIKTLQSQNWEGRAKELPRSIVRKAVDHARKRMDAGLNPFYKDDEGREGKAKGGKIDKKKMACNKPKRTASHPKKSHVVKACKDGKEKIIRFGEQGAKTAGKPKAGESKRMKAKRKSFKARHRKNIKRGNMSAAYWADKVKW